MSTISSVVLVDKRIQDHETIVSAVKADGVRAIVFDVAEVDAHCAAAAAAGGSSSASASSAFQYILNEIAALGATSFSNIGIVQHNTGTPFHRFFAMTHGEMSTVVAVCRLRDHPQKHIRRPECGFDGVCALFGPQLEICH